MQCTTIARVIIECDLFRYRVFVCETKPINSNKVQGSPVFIDGESHAHPDKLAYRDICNKYFITNIIVMIMSLPQNLKSSLKRVSNKVINKASFLKTTGVKLNARRIQQLSLMDKAVATDT